MESGWNENEGEWKKEDAGLAQRASELKQFLYSLPVQHVVLVSHASFLEHLTEQDGWVNTEFRSFEFTSAGPTCIQETEESNERRRTKPAGGFKQEFGELNSNPQGLCLSPV
ncbi:hypothetical protein LTR70_007782 [Exophiala xenobiotica]|nr:hypothetical protein LTR70_007782 [Exophiala xenobiotica]